MAEFGPVIVGRTSTVDVGDFAIDAEPTALAARRQHFQPGAWVWLRQVHGASVITVDRASAAAACGTSADALVTADAGVVLSVQTADCAPVLFHSPEGIIGVAHAGWRGTAAGVVQATVAAMANLGATAVDASMGPCILAGCYEFSGADLDPLVTQFGPTVRGVTSRGTPALDVVAAVRAAATDAGVRCFAAPGESVSAAIDIGPDTFAGGSNEDADGRRAAATRHGAMAGPWCTACHPGRFFSYRARADRGRLATVITRRETS